MNLQNFARVIFSIKNIHKTYNLKEKEKETAKIEYVEEEDTTQGLLKKLNQIEQSISNMIDLRREWML